MKQQIMTLREVAAALDVPAHVVVYAITSGRAKEPLRISGRRMFSQTDIDSLRKVVLGKERRHGQ